MQRQEVSEPNDARLASYVAVGAPAELRRRGLFVAESREVVRVLVSETPEAVESVFLTDTAAGAMAEVLATLPEATPVYVGPRSLLEEIVGFQVHRGCLSLARRPVPRPLERLLPPATDGSRLLLLDRVADPDNVGSLFRNGLALGADLVLLGPGCADPLYRKAIRTSIGATLRLPWTGVEDWPAAAASLRAAGYTLVALTPGGELEIAELPDEHRHRLALLLGNEGEGLAEARIAMADFSVRIGMRSGVDSVNVATAGAIALHAWADLRGAATAPTDR